ncbi:MAG: hypothetical protein ACYDDF_14295 [Thermoplasmatota archaeon]
MRHRAFAIVIAAILGLTVLNLPAVQGMDMCNPDVLWQTAQQNCPGWYSQFKVIVTDTSTHNPLAYNDANGPAPDELVRSIPADPAIPSRFVGLPDVLVKDASADAPPSVYKALTASEPTSAPIHAVLDAQLISTTAGYADNDFNPAAYFGARGLQQTMTYPAYVMFAWYGYWQENSEDNAIDDQSCTQPYFCGPQDEFVWRGLNTNESVEGLKWDFPGSWLQGGNPLPTVGAGYAGNCQAYAQYDQDCYAPGPVSGYWDQSNWTTGQQSWPDAGGYPTIAPEQTLVASHYVITVFGPQSLQETSNYSYTVDAPATTPGFFRAMDWFQALAPAAVSSLYVSTVHNVHNTSVTSFIPPGLIPTIPPFITSNISSAENSTNFVFQNASYAEEDALRTCPSQTPTQPESICARDVRQSVAQANQANVSPPGATDAPYIGGSFQIAVPGFTYLPTGNGQPFSAYWCGQVGQPSSCMQVIPETGVIGYAAGIGYPLGSCLVPACIGPALVNQGNGETTYMPPGFVIIGATQAWAWDDVNHDGYIGSPDEHTIQQYLAGNYATANIGGGDLLTGVAPQLPGVTVSPGAGGWPSGSYYVTNAENPYASSPLGPGPSTYLTPLSGQGSVFLRTDPLCSGGATGCATEDGLFIPEGTLAGLTGEIVGTISWTETTSNGQQSYSFHQDVKWTQSV